MKNFLLSLFLLLGLLFSAMNAEPLQVVVAADAAILMNADTGAILYEKQAHAAHHPASIAKIATAFYALKKKEGRLDEIVTIDQEAIGSVTEEFKLRSNYKIPAYRMVVGGSHIGLKRGEQMTLRDLLYGLLIASGDDAANAIAQHVGNNSITDFMTELNQFLQDIGCHNTTLLNPHGLHHPDQKTTAYDMALLTRMALKNPTFCEMVKTVRYTRPKTNKQEATTWVQTNRLLRQGPVYYPKAIGVKTGHGSPALNTFVGAAQHEGRTLIVVLLHTKDRIDIFNDSIRLFDAAFAEKKLERILIKEGAQKYALQVEGLSTPVNTYVKNSVKIRYYPAEEPVIKASLVWDQVKLPIAKDQRVGEIRLLDARGTVLQAIPLLAQEEAKLSAWSRFKELF